MKTIDLKISGNRTHDIDIYLNEDRYDKPKEYFKVISDLIEKRCGDSESLADVGCATGEYLYYIKERYPKIKRMVGIDNVDKLLAAARKKLPEIEFYIGDLENNLFQEEEKFDVVTCFGVMPCVFHLENAINNLLNLLSPNGHLFLFALANEEPIDVQLVYKRSNKEENIWEVGKNCYSLETYGKILSSRCRKVEVLDFDLPFSIAKTNDPLRSWTEEFRGKKNHLFYGTGQIATQKIIIAAT